MRQLHLGGLVNQWMISGIATIQSGPNLYATNNPDFPLTGQLDVLTSGGQPATIPVSSQELLGAPDVYLMPMMTCNPGISNGSHHCVNGSCSALPTTLGINGPYREPYLRGPAYTDSDLALQKSFGVGEGRNILVRYSAFNFLNHANTTFSSSVAPNKITLNYTNLSQGAAQPVSAALADATNANAGVF